MKMVNTYQGNIMFLLRITISYYINLQEGNLKVQQRQMRIDF